MDRVREPPLRAHPQSLRPRPNRGRLIRRRGRDRGLGRLALRPRQRHRRLDPHPGLLLRRLRPQVVAGARCRRPGSGRWPTGESARLLGVGTARSARGGPDAGARDRSPGPDGAIRSVGEVELGDPAEVRARRDAGARQRALLAATRLARAVRGQGASRRSPRGGGRHAWSASRCRRMRRDGRAVPRRARGRRCCAASRPAGRAGAAPLTWRTTLRRGGDHTVATRFLLTAERLTARLPERRTRRLLEAGTRVRRGAPGDDRRRRAASPLDARRGAAARSHGRPDLVGGRHGDRSTSPACRSRRSRSA